MAEEKDTAGLVSALEDYPEFVQAIGMISIELADLEVSLADLLAMILDVDTAVAQAIYFTPKAVIPRVEVLMNVNRALHPDEGLDKEEMKTIRKRLKSICDRAVAIMGKRNGLLHASWGVIGDEEPNVHYSSLPLKEGGFKPAKLTDLKRIVSDMRRLTNDIFELVDLIEVYRQTESEAAHS